jgi:hypothetical protein
MGWVCALWMSCTLFSFLNKKIIIIIIKVREAYETVVYGKECNNVSGKDVIVS